MGRKSKYSSEEKLTILNEADEIGVSSVADMYHISESTIRSWQLLYKYQGVEGLTATHSNQRYSREFKYSLVEQFEQSGEPVEVFAIKHGLRAKAQLQRWIIQYNESNFKAYTPRKRDSKMSGRKTSFEERLNIIEELIKYDVNYNWVAEKYQVSYQQVYGWY
ncbi:hypothetical protein [Limosilactobacillus mucosae]|mgnify:FL=1|uniref:hypothetical protein n=1 Tax=Limosilactobacillus mucosae TaxID=97478 RepID=UPI003A520BA6